MTGTGGGSCGVKLALQPRYQNQSWDGLCGAACADTILSTKGQTVQQPQIWTEIQTNTQGPSGVRTIASCGNFTKQICECGWCWCTHPDALARTLTQYLSMAYQVHKPGTDADATVLVRTCLDQGVLPLLLAFDFMHWVVPYGYKCNPANTPKITDFWVHDPNVNVTLNLVAKWLWDGEYLFAITCGKYANSIPIVAPAITVAPVIPVSSQQPGLSTAPTPLPPDEVSSRVRVEIEQMSGDETWRVAFGNVNASAPFLVRNLRSDRRYYIVAFRSPDGRETARMTVNAYTGERGQVAGIARADDPPLPPFIQPADVPEVLRRQDGPSGKAGHPLGLASFSVADELVWTACDQSLTMYQPFYVLTRGSETLYLRVDGQLFGSLTRAGAGM